MEGQYGLHLRWVTLSAYIGTCSQFRSKLQNWQWISCRVLGQFRANQWPKGFTNLRDALNFLSLYSCINTLCSRHKEINKKKSLKSLVLQISFKAWGMISMTTMNSMKWTNEKETPQQLFFPLTFDLGRSVATVRATQPVFWLLLQELLANRLGLFSKFGWVRLLRLTNPSIHFFPLDFLFACSKRSLAFDHFVD